MQSTETGWLGACLCCFPTDLVGVSGDWVIFLRVTEMESSEGRDHIQCQAITLSLLLGVDMTRVSLEHRDKLNELQLVCCYHIDDNA